MKSHPCSLPQLLPHGGFPLHRLQQPPRGEDVSLGAGLPAEADREDPWVLLPYSLEYPPQEGYKGQPSVDVRLAEVLGLYRNIRLKYITII